MSAVFWFATNSEHPRLTEDDRMAMEVLRDADIPSAAFCWGTIPPGMCLGDVVVIRSCWDYHLQPARFSAWLRSLTEAGIRVANGSEWLAWNMHKRYLLELEREHGIEIPKSRLYSRGQDATLAEAMAVLGTSQVVVKPAISLSAHATYRIEGCDAAAERMFARQWASHDVLVQAYVPQVQEGELSLVYFGNRFSHAVRKIPAAGDFRVQRDFGARHLAIEPPPAAVAQANRILEVTGDDFEYARVDGLMVDGRFVLMELELIDPVLFFGMGARAANRFVDVLLERFAVEPVAAR